MNSHLYAQEKRSDYENFYATCPYCEYENIFNRASDLKTSNPISFRTVRCFSADCEQEFNINGDRANAPHEMLIYDCYELYKQKKYSYCILNLAQAYEVYFALFLNVRLVYQPFNNGIYTTEKLNEMLLELYQVTKKCTYYPMRNIFFNVIINEIEPKSFSESMIFIENIPKYGSNVSITKFESISNIELRDILISIEATNISDLRNNVVHKMAYRASASEAESSIEETRKNLFTVSRILNIFSDDVNVYLFK